MDKRDLKQGQAYASIRDDINDIKVKYQIYLADDAVLLINTNRSKMNFSMSITPKDCSFLQYESYICLDVLYTYDNKYTIIDITDLSQSILIRLRQLVSQSYVMPTVHIKRVQELIDEILEKSPVE